MEQCVRLDFESFYWAKEGLAPLSKFKRRKKWGELEILVNRNSCTLMEGGTSQGTSFSFLKMKFQKE